MRQDGAYQTSEEHLWEELRRIDLLIRAQTLRWRASIGKNKPEQLWGMVHVTDAEIDAYLEARFALVAELAPETEPELRKHWGEAGQLAGQIAVRCAATTSGTPLRLENLRRLFSLSSAEKDVLLVSILPELDPRYRRLFGYLQDDASRTRPSIELVLQILCPEAGHAADRHMFDAAGGLLSHHLLAPLDGQWDEPLPLRALRADDRIVSYLLGRDAPDGRLKNIVSMPADAVAWDSIVADEEWTRRLRSLAHWSGPGATVLLHGPPGSGRLLAARAVCAEAGLPLLAVNIASALRSPIGWERITDIVLREARLQNAALCWSGFELLQGADLAPRLSYLLSALERFPGLNFLTGKEAWAPVGYFRDTPFLSIDFPAPAYPVRRRLWERYLPDSTPSRVATAGALANGFQFTGGQIVDAVATARSLALMRNPQAPLVTSDDLFEACRRQSGRNLISFARRIEPRTELTFEDLILPSPNRRQLEELRARIRNRSRVQAGLGFERWLSLGKGLIAMFTGASGTGKTMAAELLAREHGVDLYKVDLSQVVSKYVGETEKNLSSVFKEAEDSNAIIFFDEADALFGKRGEVKEAKDRWANIEVNYLLQRVEEYAGVVILASNLRQNIDEAFLRRIHVIVDFPSPDAMLRARIWNGMFPSGVERPSDEEIRTLAERFRLAGGSIRNVVFDAAYRAIATANGHAPSITMQHLVFGIAREYQKLGKPITKGEFEAEYYGWVEEGLL